MPHLFLFREDLRLTDNPALQAAISSGKPLICLFVHDEVSDGEWIAGGARKWWLHHSLNSLSEDMKAINARLIIIKGSQNEVVTKLVKKHKLEHVYWNRRYGPYQIAQDKELKASLNEQGIAVTSLNGRLLFEPWTFKTGTGAPYRVFTPFWKAMRSHADIRQQLPSVKNIQNYNADNNSVDIDALNLLPTRPNWAKQFGVNWKPGEKGAAERLELFLDRTVQNYHEDRNRPDKTGTSGLSPHLQFGEISPAQIWQAVQNRMVIGNTSEHPAYVFLSEIAWREFSYVLLFHNPDMLETEIKDRFKKFPWSEDIVLLQAWKKGETGYPIVDAGMRQLWQTGWMHNRVRMIVGSFLVKHLLIDWREGMKWFWDTLVDADIAANTASWQWIAGCGADAAPYFRIFNPVIQGKKFDPAGEYIRRYVPELKGLPQKYINTPWEAPDNILKKANITLGQDYPLPIVEHKFARERALAAYSQTKP